MEEELRASFKPGAKDTLTAALLDVQKKLVPLTKNAANSFIGNKFVSLDSLMSQVLPLLNDNGLVLLQFPTTIGENVPGLTTSIIHAKTGEMVESVMPLVMGKVDPQGLGSAITYTRRYMLMSSLGIVADSDDDAEAAMPRKPKARKDNDSNSSQTSTIPF